MPTLSLQKQGDKTTPDKNPNKTQPVSPEAKDLKKGERVRLVLDKAEGVYEVLEVASNKFRTELKAEGQTVFVYGREVKDFRNLDYDAISMLHVSATQQLKKEKDEEVKVLRAEIAELKTANDALEKRLPLLESKLQTAVPAVVAAKSGSNGNGRHEKSRVICRP